MRFFVVPLIVAIILCLIVDSYIFCQIKGKSKTIKIFRGIHVAVALLLDAFIISLAVAPKSLWSADFTTTALCIYAFASILLAKVVFTIVSALKIFFKRKTTVNYVAATLAVLMLGYMVYATAVNRYDIKINNVEVTLDGLPKSFSGYRIAQISDFHIGTYGNDTAFVSKAVNVLNAQGADMIVFTGDLVNNNAAEVKPFVKILSRLSAPDGVVSILGNHDYGDYAQWRSPDEKSANLAQLCDYQAQAGWKLLRNESMALTRSDADSLIIIGVENIGEPRFHTYGDLRKSYPNLNDDNCKILLSHNPFHWMDEVVPDSNIALMLAGHTHAMQFAFSFFGKEVSPSSLSYKQWKGLYSEGNQLLYVNVGLGCVGIPARFGIARPEITVFTLKAKD